MSRQSRKSSLLYLLLCSPFLTASAHEGKRRDVSFEIAHSFAFPEIASTSMIVQDAPDDSGAHSDDTSRSLPPIRARSVQRSVKAPSERDTQYLGLGFLDALDLGPHQLPLGVHSPSRFAPRPEPAEETSVPSPDVSDRETLLNLARASWDAYHPVPTEEHWYDIHGLNWTSRFGWRPNQDGLRGHLFLSPDKQDGLIVFKGTTITQLAGGDDPVTSKRDRLNDNLLFSCCCANVPWRVETTHPCSCKSANGKCCSSCLSDSLRDEETYYKNAEMVVHYFQHKYPSTSFWLAGHSLGGSIASLVGIHRSLPTITFEAPGERLAALRLGLIPSITAALSLEHITHVWNDIDPLPQGLCTGAWSTCAQAGYAMESRCHTGKVIVYEQKGKKGRWKLALLAHRMGYVVEMLEDEETEVPEAVTQSECEDCPSWDFGEFTGKKPWWRKVLNWTFSWTW